MGSKRVEEEFDSLVKENAWLQAYQKITCKSVKADSLVAKQPCNKTLNRYRDVNPYDHSRVILKRTKNDYINANIVEVPRANRKYILTQGPLVYTISHFWLMAWEQRSAAIVMLNNTVEKNEVKCQWYWPQGSGPEHKMVLEDVDLSIEQTDKTIYSHYVTRKFTITDLTNGETREITQFHYTTWPDFAVPSSQMIFLKFLKHVRSSGALEEDVGPAIVHCSAGIGRSGTFCLVDSVLKIIEAEGQENVDVQEILIDMRKYRMGLIQTSEQLRFSYQAIVEGIARLRPDFVETEDENIYSSVESEEAPPPPPPRGASLGGPPARPLPAIPTSASVDVINMAGEGSEGSVGSERSEPSEGSISDDVSADSSDRDSRSSTPSEDRGATCVSDRAANNEANKDDDSETSEVGDAVTNEVRALRKRRNEQTSERIEVMRKKARKFERWQSFKRSLYTPIAISVSVLLAGVLIYMCVKH